MNSWPGGFRRALSQDEHQRWNSYNYPGTLQLCFLCDTETGRCEEDDIWSEDQGPFCLECYKLHQIRYLLR